MGVAHDVHEIDLVYQWDVRHALLHVVVREHAVALLERVAAHQVLLVALTASVVLCDGTSVMEQV